ncbi:MAG: sugar ABC transporter substrate-binding protein [Filifactor alocis]|nr:sugar ABC transporter substrate-binding protein [Filifactor alocis]
MKKPIRILLASFMGLSLLLGGCAGKQVAEEAPAAEQGGETPKIAYVTMDVTSPYFIKMIDGMKEEAEALGVELSVHDGKYQAQPQIDAIDTLITQGVDAIILSANDPAALQPSVDKAKEAGIKVVAANVEMQNTDAFVSLVEKDYGLTGGEIAGKYIAEKMGGEAEVAILTFTQVPAVIQRAEGLKEGIFKHAPNAKVVTEVEASTREAGLKAIENVLQTNPNLNVVVGINDDAVLGGYEAMMAAKRTGDDVCLVGLDAVDEAIAKVKEGGIYRGTVDIDPFGSGKFILNTTKKVLDGETMSEMIKFPMVPVTKENIDKY